MTVGRVNYGSWLFRVLGWDGLLPACVFLIPNVIEFVFPNNRRALELTGVITPVIMLILRLIVGKRHIAANTCSAAVQRSQLCIFCLGILVLGLIDGVLIRSHLMPKGTFKGDDFVVFVVLMTLYLTSMTIAMYPGCSSPQDELIWPEDTYDTREM